MKEIKTENREYRSDVFSMLMEYPEYALNVYNALNDTYYDDPSMVEIKTLEKGISLSVRNDASFIIKADLNIYEHQSTYNPNMPLRSLIYFSEIIKEFIKDKNIYGSKLIRIPTPKFVVFYNGKEKRAELEIQRLSDSYEHDSNITLELVCIAYNINPENNDGLKQKSFVLEGYTIFVEKVKEFVDKGDKNAVSHAVDYCKVNNILKRFFDEREDEVIKSMTVDMTFEKRIELSTKEAYEDGYELGKESGYELGKESGYISGAEDGRNTTLFMLVNDKIITPQIAAERVNLSVDEFESKYEEWKKTNN